MRFTFFIFLVATAILSCSDIRQNEKNANKMKVESGSWRFVLNLGNKLLPFNAAISTDGDTPKFTVINGEEKIELQDVQFRNDSILATFPVFQTSLKLRIEAPGLLSGKWIDPTKENYAIPLNGEFNKNFRFTSSKSSQELPARYRVKFDYLSEEPWDAILKLQNDNGELEGTFLTETGDYRFLDGNIMNNKVYLSTFDGSHAFYFEADIKADSLINGIFQSGTHYQTTWKANSDNGFELRAPEDLTYIKKGFDHFDFSLPNQDGDTVKWEDLNLDSKAVIVDIMGSWCPNCLDANRALKKLQSEFDEDQLEVLTIAFERTDNLSEARERIFRMQEELDIEQGFLFGGRASKKSASDAFPMLNHIMSYPTLIFIDKSRQVRYIYTGFYGPGTGNYYSHFMEETDSIIRAMINEPA